MQTLKVAERHDLIDIFDDRYQLCANLIISQRPPSQWHASIGDSTLADAILDRLIQNARIIFSAKPIGTVVELDQRR